MTPKEFRAWLWWPTYHYPLHQPYYTQPTTRQLVTASVFAGSPHIWSLTSAMHSLDQADANAMITVSQ
jgi:hypothetical protein